MQNRIGAVLRKLERRSRLEKSRKIDVERDRRMLAITKETGVFFSQLLASMKARQVLELGTSVGYSTLWFASILAQGHKKSKIITIEQNQDKIKRARRNFERAGVNRLIQIKQGRILDVLKSMPKKPRFDFVLIDADKENTRRYFDLVLPMTKIGGIIATDNMLYPKKYQNLMRRYARYIAKKSNVRTATLPLGNGEEITIRIR
ncbi:MAG: O-methyltransferase [Thermoproteota archaeon]